MDIVLRDVKSGEEQKIFSIVKKVLEQYCLKTNPEVTDKDLSDIKKHYIETGGCFKIIEDNGRIVGSYGLFPLSSDTCELRKMYLLSEYQGRGLGKLMMNDAIKVAQDKGFKEMVLETNSILDKAIRLYRKYGFQEYQPEHFSDRCDCAMKLRL